MSSWFGVCLTHHIYEIILKWHQCVTLGFLLKARQLERKSEHLCTNKKNCFDYSEEALAKLSQISTFTCTSRKQANIRATMSRFSWITSLRCCVWPRGARRPGTSSRRVSTSAIRQLSSVQRRVSDSAKSWRLLQVVPAVLILILSVPSGGLIVHISSTHLLLYALIIY